MANRYWAFISYSSNDDTAARKLHRKIEAYRVPRDLVGRPGRDGPIPRRLLPVFRDRVELELSSELGAEVEDALAASRYLVVLCSPDAARSCWVNEEIRYFKSLGREDRILAVIARGEPNASDEPAAADEECFPAALRFRVDNQGQLTDERTEPVGGDLRPGGDGWTRTLLKVIAGATGMGFDAFARRDQKRRRRRKAALATVACLLLASSVWLWDYNRLKTSYFAGFMTRWGVPIGVGELDDDVRNRRQYHYRIESRRGRVRRVLRVNSVGQLVDDENEYGASIRVVHYRENDSLEQIDFLERNGRVVLRHAYSERRPGADGEIQYVDFRQEHQDAPLAQAPGGRYVQDADSVKTDNAALRVRYDGEGRVVEKRYVSAYRVPRADEQGSFGQRLAYDKGLLPTRLTSIGPDGNPREQRTGILAVLRTYGSLGDVLIEAYVGRDDQPVLGADGYASAHTRRDARGNVVEEAYFGLNAEPVLSKLGFHRSTQAFDERGNVVEWASFGTDGKPRPVGEFVRITYSYDASGHLITKVGHRPDGTTVQIR